MPTELTVTVVTGHEGSADQIDLARESAMVKAGLLYGDRVRLVSRQAVAISTVAAAYVASGPERATIIEGLLAERDPMSAAMVIRLQELRRKPGRTGVEILDMAQLEELTRKGGDLIQGSLRGILGESGLAELMPAAEAGLLSLDPLGLDEGHGLDSGLADRFRKVVASIVAPGSNAFPLLDDDAGRYARAIDEGTGVSLAIGGRARELRLAGDLFEMLPAFPAAPMKAVLEAREALAVPLVRFRASLVGLAAAIEEFPGDPDFGARVADVWRSDVAPALEELKELDRERGLGSLLRHSLFSMSPSRLVEAAVAAASAATNSIPTLVAAAAAAGVDLLASAHSQREELTEEMRGSRFLLLYEADRRLAER